MQRITTLGLIAAAICLWAYTANAQQATTKISGYIQTEWQHFDQSSSANSRAFYWDARKDFFLIRRGRMKVTHSNGGIMSGVLQVDMTERGVSIKDAYAGFAILPDNHLDLTLGLFNRPNYEVEYSSSKRESPERAQVIKAFYDDERDLGFMATSNYALATNFAPTLQVGLFNGTKIETDAYKDVIARLTFPIPLGDSTPVQIHLGGSIYYGGIPQTGDSVIKTENGIDAVVFEEGTDGWKGWGNRSHVGIETQIHADVLPFGKTTVRGEFLTGTRPEETTLSIGGGNDQLLVQLRDQMGYYLYFIQNIGDDVQLVGKYDFFDRNTNRSGAQVNSRLDIASSILGFGANMTIDNLRITAWYEIPTFAANESRITDGSGVVQDTDLKDNKTTVRFQYKF